MEGKDRIELACIYHGDRIAGCRDGGPGYLKKVQRRFVSMNCC